MLAPCVAQMHRKNSSLFGFSLLALLTTFLWSFEVRSQDNVKTTETIFSSLALVVNNQTNGETSTGTAFCVYSTKFKSYFITNRHVIENSKEILVRPPQSVDPHGPWRLASDFVKARTYPRPPGYSGVSDLDLAVIVIDAGGIPSVSFDFYMPGVIWVDALEGASIGIAGYPSFRFMGATLQDVRPSVHFGTLNAFSDIYIEYDAVTDHGNSGGPLFSMKRGHILGVVTLGVSSNTSSRVQNNLAIHAKYVINFLRESYVPFYEYEPNSAKVLPEIPCKWDHPHKQKFCSLPDAVTQ
jgi:S1-C subfamily serine protease